MEGDCEGILLYLVVSKPHIEVVGDAWGGQVSVNPNRHQTLISRRNPVSVLPTCCSSLMAESDSRIRNAF